MTQYAGIDYSLGKSNFDPENGIHFGCISQNEVLQVWADDSEPEYPQLECSECNQVITIDMDECPKCKANLINEFDCIEAIGFNLDDGEYKAFSDDSGDIMIIKSPYYTYAQYCSPCAPGAGYLMNPYRPEKNTVAFDHYQEYAKLNGFPKVYCFGHNWFDDGKAPYPVFSVATGELVKADK